MKRRELLVGSGGLAAALLAGRAPDVQAREYSQADDSLDRSIELLPAESELDVEFRRFSHANLEETDEPGAVTLGSSVVTQIEDLDPDTVDTVSAVWTDPQLALVGISGSFERVESGEYVDEHGDWRVGHAASDPITMSSTDGLLLAARNSDTDARLDAVETATDVARNGGDRAVDTVDLLARAVDRLGDKRVVYFIPEIGEELPGVAAEQIETLAAGFEKPPGTVQGFDGTLENEFLLEAKADAELDSTAVEKLVREIEQGTVVEFDVQFEGDIVYVETVTEAPPELNRAASPDATVTMDPQPDEGTAVLEHESGESLPASELELWVNGELADDQLSSEFSAFESGDSFIVDTGPLANVTLRWVDEDANEYYEYVDEVVGEDSFDVSHDFGSGTVELTYTGKLDADPALLDLERRSEVVTEDGVTSFEREQLTEPIEALATRLTEGETIRVENVQIGDSVSLDLDIPSRPAGFGPQTTVVRYHARPPRFRITRQPDEEPHAVYRDDTARDAEAFRILVDGTEANRQPADEYDTLESGDRFPLGDQEFGTEIAIEWVGGQESVVLEEHVVTPLVNFDLRYHDGAGTVLVEHAGGETVDATALDLLFDGSPAPTQPGDGYTTFGRGDVVSAPVDPFTTVEVRWTNGETEQRLATSVTGNDLFEAAYDPVSETLDLTYVGKQPADPSKIRVERLGRQAPDQQLPAFDADAEELTSGDSATVEEVDPETIVRLVRTGDQPRHRPVAHFRPDPSYGFDFEKRDGTLTATYSRQVAHDASEFRVLADGTETDVQPADQYDTLEQDDTVTLGSFPADTTIVVEWPTSVDPTEIDRHVVTPTAEFDAEYDDSEEVVRVEHAGGDDIEATDLGIYVPSVTEQLVIWGEDGTVSEGDSTTIAATEKPDVVLVVFKRRQALAEIQLS